MKGLRRVISGAQTGVDRAAIDAAMLRSAYSWGGCVPKGRLAEDGEIPDKYFNPKRADCGLYEHKESRNYKPRTVKNILDSDATMVLRFIGAGRTLSPWTKLTITTARSKSKPYIIFDPSKIRQVPRAVKWIVETKIEYGDNFRPIEVLNVAGPRESGSPGIYECTKIFMHDVLGYVYAYQRWGLKIWDLTGQRKKK